ncbi:MAG TPA: glycosyltransferase, partial [Magnetospirillaceae bacterium]|nr:glycosyltransferase [Magnetospirillaceae bacterium]
MPDHDHALHRLKEQNKLLESELNIIKTSRSYKLARTAAVVKNKFRKDPGGTVKKAISLLLRKPAKLLRLAKGGSAPSAIQDVIQNRVAQYHAWIVLNEPNEEQLEQQRKAAQKFAKKPLISIITPVFNPPADVLEELLESVLAQTYPYFELCIGNVGKDEAVKKLLATYAAQDSRIKVFSFSTNLGIGGDSNRVLKKVKGDYIALLDHDDTLAPDALYENAKLINAETPDFIYSDKDMIDEQGVRYEPLFKPEWSPEVMLSANYPTHLNVMRTSLVREVGGWDGETNGAQDWDLFLKVTHISKKISHIPKILYHWRVIATSTALSIDTKPYALAGQRRAVQKYLDQEGILATPYHRKTELLLDWKSGAIDQKPLVAVHGQDVASVMRVLGRLRSTLPKTAIFCVAYQGDPSQSDIKLLQRQGANKVFDYKSGAFGKALNTMLEAYPTARTLLFADSRLKIPGKWQYGQMAGWLSIRGVGIVGGKVIGRDELIQDCGGLVTLDGPVGLFRGFPAYYQGYLGNVEWIRNLRIVSRQLFVANTDVLRRVRFDTRLPDDAVIAGAMIQASAQSRLVFCPKAAVYSRKDIGALPREALAPISANLLAKTLKQPIDTFSNPNVLAHDPMQLNIEQPELPSVSAELDVYQRDALVLSRLYDLTADDITYNRELGKKPVALDTPKTVGWFLPGFDSIYAGLNNIFSFAEFLANQGVKTHFYIMRGDQGVAQERELVTRQYPDLKDAQFVSITSEAPQTPALDIGICTQWATAYPLAKLRNVKR